jgi:hypothetical protein
MRRLIGPDSSAKNPGWFQGIFIAFTGQKPPFYDAVSFL